MFLHNRINKAELKEQLMAEPFKRRTISFYRYVIIENAQEFRDRLYKEWFELNCFGRIYIAREGINAQMSVPEDKLETFLRLLDQHAELQDMPIKYAIEDDGKSFYKLTLKVRPKIVADGLDDGSFDVTNVGTHLSAMDFHKEVEKGEAIVIDMRNHYESEVGRFEGAVCPDADTFRDEIQMVVNDFSNQKDKKFLLYCTGGIRCEKASAYLRHHGFKDVNQLHGGVIEYAQQIKQLNIKSKFIGKNFVFDERLGESVDGQIISRCHQCGRPADTHTNCANDACHLLFIQCDQCREEYNGCCSAECKEILTLPAEKQKEVRVAMQERFAQSKIFKSRLRPDLRDQFHAEAGILKMTDGR
ncbi:MAG TPA: rhodanese-related sulfurtransferase [Bacteroidales bacterium]|nr:rhodanese-related sulfurtransferase [Bacteroidales bacterium]